MKTSKFLHILLVICAVAALAAGPLPGIAEHVDDADCGCSVQYVPTDPEKMFDPPVRMTVFGVPDESILFTIKLAATERNIPMPEGSENGVKTFGIAGSEMISLGTWSYTEPGVYHYTVSVVNDGDTSYTYDTAVYTITDMVKAEGTALTLNRVITNRMKKQVKAMNFMNKYDAGQGAYNSYDSDGAVIIETKTENHKNNNYYYIMMGLGALLALGAAIDLFIGFMRTTIKVRVRA